VGPELAYLKQIGRAQFHSVTDEEALRSFQLLARLEGIIPALESAHAIAFAERFGKGRKKDEIMVLNLSGRGDKDVQNAAEYLKMETL
jgi:tryptophan synthase beta chain